MIKLGKEPPGNTTDKFQASEPRSSVEEVFIEYFIFEPKTPCRRAVLDPRATM